MFKSSKEKKVHSNKKIRVNASISQDAHIKLKKLAISCDVTKTMLAAMMIEFCVNHPDIIEYFQDKYNPEDSDRQEYKVTPISKNGKLYY